MNNADINNQSARLQTLQTNFVTVLEKNNSALAALNAVITQQRDILFNTVDILEGENALHLQRIKDLSSSRERLARQIAEKSTQFDNVLQIVQRAADYLKRTREAMAINIEPSLAESDLYALLRNTKHLLFSSGDSHANYTTNAKSVNSENTRQTSDDERDRN